MEPIPHPMRIWSEVKPKMAKHLLHWGSCPIHDSSSQTGAKHGTRSMMAGSAGQMRRRQVHSGPSARLPGPVSRTGPPGTTTQAVLFCDSRRARRAPGCLNGAKLRAGRPVISYVPACRKKRPPVPRGRVDPDLNRAAFRSRNEFAGMHVPDRRPTWQNTT